MFSQFHKDSRPQFSNRCLIQTFLRQTVPIYPEKIVKLVASAKLFYCRSFATFAFPSQVRFPMCGEFKNHAATGN